MKYLRISNNEYVSMRELSLSTNSNREIIDIIDSIFIWIMVGFISKISINTNTFSRFELLFIVEYSIYVYFFY